MKTRLCLLLAVLASLGCARIYRPVALAQPRAVLQGGTGHGDLAGQAVLQPWGDNSRYERKALRANLRVVALALENRSGADLELLRVELPEGATAPSPGAAAALVKQQSLAYLLYPLLPALVSLGSADRGSGYGPSDRMVFQGLSILGLGVALPNAIIATRSNRRLEAFFRGHAWMPGPLGAGQGRQGLIFVLAPTPHHPLPVRVVYRTPGGDRSLELIVPGVAPP